MHSILEVKSGKTIKKMPQKSNVFGMTYTYPTITVCVDYWWKIPRQRLNIREYPKILINKLFQLNLFCQLSVNRNFKLE